MTDHLIVRKQLAAVASFRILYDKQKDSYAVLRCFIKSTIANHAIRSFTASDLLIKLEEDYGFGKLPVFVVEKALKQLGINHSKKGYICDILPSIESDLSEELEKTDDNTQIVLNRLYEYFEKKKSIVLTETDKRSIDNALSDYLLYNRNEDDYSLIISSFIVESEGDTLIQKILDEMREGMILYRGLSYSSSKNASEKWKTMTVFLDTELLFHACGLNGELCKKVFDDFKTLVDEINLDSERKNGKKVIAFRCFDYVYKEVDAIFSNARDIVENKAKLPPGKTAHELLVSGVKDGSEIVRKRAEFDEKIKSLGIEPDDQPEGYYSVSSYSFNIEDIELLNSLKKSLQTNSFVNENKISDALKSLSCINVKRKNYAPKVFEEAKVILLTENNTTKRIAHSSDLRKQGVIPLCTDLYEFTNNLWLILGKGFGPTTTPSVFAAANKARFILSSTLERMVTDQYEKLCEEYDTGKLSEDKASDYLYHLKMMVKKPEDIKGSDASEIAMSINGGLLERRIQEQALKDSEHIKVIKKYEEQSAVVLRYEKQEASKEYEKAICDYKQKRNSAYKSALCGAIRVVGLFLSLVVISMLIGIVTRINGTGIMITVLSSILPLLLGLIWFLAKKDVVRDSFSYCFTKLAKTKLKRKVIGDIQQSRPSYSSILSCIKERDGSN